MEDLAQTAHARALHTYLKRAFKDKFAGLAAVRIADAEIAGLTRRHATSSNANYIRGLDTTSLTDVTAATGVTGGATVRMSGRRIQSQSQQWNTSPAGPSPQQRPQQQGPSTPTQQSNDSPGTSWSPAPQPHQQPHQQQPQPQQPQPQRPWWQLWNASPGPGTRSSPQINAGGRNIAPHHQQQIDGGGRNIVPHHPQSPHQDHFPNHHGQAMFHDAATPDEIRQRYKELARQYHPNKNPGKNTTEQFQNLQNQYKRAMNHAEERQRRGGGSSSGQPPQQPQRSSVACERLGVKAYPGSRCDPISKKPFSRPCAKLGIKAGDGALCNPVTKQQIMKNGKPVVQKQQLQQRPSVACDSIGIKAFPGSRCDPISKKPFSRPCAKLGVKAGDGALCNPVTKQQIMKNGKPVVQKQQPQRPQQQQSRPQQQQMIKRPQQPQQSLRPQQQQAIKRPQQQQVIKRPQRLSDGSTATYGGNIQKLRASAEKMGDKAFGKLSAQVIGRYKDPVLKAQLKKNLEKVRTGRKQQGPARQVRVQQNRVRRKQQDKQRKQQAVGAKDKRRETFQAKPKPKTAAAKAPARVVAKAPAAKTKTPARPRPRPQPRPRPAAARPARATRRTLAVVKAVKTKTAAATKRASSGVKRRVVKKR